MKIGELASAVGLNTITIRYYESRGLLPAAERTRSNYRVYGDAEVQRLQFIKKAKRLGLSLDEIRSILQLYERREPTCSHVRSLLDQKLAQVELLLIELQEFKSDLVKLREASGLIEDCRPSGGRICRFIETSEVELGKHARALVDSADGVAAKRR